MVPWEAWEDLEAMERWVQDPVAAAWEVVEASTAPPTGVGLEVSRGVEEEEEEDCRPAVTRLW